MSPILPNWMPSSYRWLPWLLRLLTRQAWLFRRLANHEWMPTIESTYVIQHLERRRDQAWGAYESARYGPGEAYLARIKEVNAAHRWPPLMLPPELDPSQYTPLRWHWLQMTEALAECYAFSNPPPPRGPEERQPKLLQAAELLAHAGEVQHEIVGDLQRSAMFLQGDARMRLEAAVRQEVTLACHFFDLSTRCLEAWLDAAWSLAPGRTRSRAERWEHFCNSVMMRVRDLDSIAGTPEMLPWYVRSTLANRYGLLDLLEARLGQGRHDHYRDTPQWSPDFSEPTASTVMGADLTFLLAECARDASQASLWLEFQRGDPSLDLWLLQGNRWEDKLAMVDIRLARARRLAEEHGESRGRVVQAIERIIHLWGLAVEQDMVYLHAGSDVWYERCELAADLYSYEGSARVRRLGSLLEIVSAAFPGERDEREAEDEAEIGGAETIIEIG